MNLLDIGLGSIIKSVGNVIDDLHTSDEEELKLGLEAKKLELEEKVIEANILKGQTDINIEEAKHKSIFVAGWRPFIGWVGGFALVYQFIAYPLLIWLWFILQAKGILSANFNPPPVLDTGTLTVILTGMLGIAGMRTFDKLKNTQTDIIK